MRTFTRTALISLCALALNILTVFIFYSVLHIPLFFDTVFTVAVCFYLGLFPALFVSLSYNVLNTLYWWLYIGRTDPLFMLYAICGVLIVLVTWLFSRHRAEFRISPAITACYLVLIAVISSVCSIVVGGIIDYFHLSYFDVPDMMNPIKHFTEAFVHQKFSLFASCIFAQAPVSFTDRLITTFAGYGAFRFAERILGRAR